MLFPEKFVTEKAAEKDLQTFGLTAPSVKATVTLLKADKKTEERVYLIGKETETRGSYYAKLGDRDLIFVSGSALVDQLQADLQELPVISFDPAKVKGMRLSGWQDVTGSPFVLDLERKAAQTWVVKAPADFKLDSAKAEALLSGLNGLRALRSAGPAKPEHKLGIKDGAMEVTITVDGLKDPLSLIVGAAAPDGYFAKVGKTPGDVVVLPKALFEQVRSKPAYLKKE